MYKARREKRWYMSKWVSKFMENFSVSFKMESKDMEEHERAMDTDTPQMEDKRGQNCNLSAPVTKPNAMLNRSLSVINSYTSIYVMPLAVPVIVSAK